MFLGWMGFIVKVSRGHFEIILFVPFAFFCGKSFGFPG